MKVNGTDCEGKTINYKIFRGSDSSSYNEFNNQPFSKVWSVGEQWNMASNLGVYYFVATLSNNASVSLTSGNLNVIIDPCLGISCGNFSGTNCNTTSSCNLNCYLNATNCITNPCVGISSCASYISESNCNANLCSTYNCIWNSTAVPPICNPVIAGNPSLSPWTNFVNFLKGLFRF